MNTTDIVLSAALSASGYKLESISNEGARGTFMFTNSPELTALVNLFDTGQLLVEPTRFNSEIRRLTTTVRRAAGLTK